MYNNTNAKAICVDQNVFVVRGWAVLQIHAVQSLRQRFVIVVIFF